MTRMPAGSLSQGHHRAPPKPKHDAVRPMTNLMSIIAPAGGPSIFPISLLLRERGGPAVSSY